MNSQKPAYSQLRAMWGVMRASLTAASRNPASIVFGLVFPLVFIVVFGFIGGGSGNYSVALEPGSVTDNPVYSALTAIDSLELTADLTAEEIAADLARGDLDAALRIAPKEGKAGFQVELTTTNASPQNGQLVASLVNAVSDKANLAAAQVSEPFVSVAQREVSGRKLTTIDFILPGQLGFSLLTSGVFATAFVFISLKQNLVIKRFFTTPVSKLSIILGEGLSRLIFALAQAAVLVAVGHFAFGYTLIHGFSTFMQIMLLAAYGLVVFLGFGFVISSLAKDERTVPPFAQLVTLPQFLLAGTFFPIELFPDWLQPIAGAMPLTFFNEAVRQVAFEGSSLLAVWPELAWLGLWGIAVYLLAIRVFKWE